MALESPRDGKFLLGNLSRQEGSQVLLAPPQPVPEPLELQFWGGSQHENRAPPAALRT